MTKIEPASDKAEAKLTAAEKELLERLRDWRSIEKPCSRCGGSGVRTYPSTAIWRGGIGGQAVTSAVCDKCWGSGDATHTWVDLRAVSARLDAEVAARESAEKRCAELEKDKERLDFIESRKSYGDWIARESGLGRGYRLHNTRREGTSPTAREAIDKAMGALTPPDAGDKGECGTADLKGAERGPTKTE